ncbi:MAG: hypothetical protein P0Y65_00840 [Candidatus Devosia phytovorans]|uniref:Glycosyltransferase RgtA/B/C/D-like domain-containing protein n=1 Tax=Candidatus Devosia phytovorans TaxID=3121372 RepID=A0AAJ6B0L4_9HYPH|nr:hypothetical protein [Devosia sp.]WEK04836.1 MAG: hypothetical protein P0Y65_00840 [Devosia sp.]
MFQASNDPAQDRPTRLVLFLPLLFVLTGTAIRFIAFRYAQPDVDWTRYFRALCRWDCGWYVKMAQTGYDPFPVPSRINAGNWAFFPFYPMLVGLIGKLIPLPMIFLASIASIVTAYAAVVVAWPLLGRNLRAYTLYAAFVLSGPVSIYFTTFMTEVMFLLLTTLAFRSLSRSNYLGAAGFTALLSSTRIVGVFISLSIGLQALLDWRRNTGSWKGWLPGLLAQPKLVLAIFISPLGLFVYMAFLNYWIGDGLAFSHVQRAWARVVGNPVFYLWRGLTNWSVTQGQWLTPSQVLALAAVAGLILTGVLAWRRQWPAVLFALLAIIIPLAAGLASMLRFMTAMAPLTITLMTLLGRWRWLFVVSLLTILIGAWFTTLAWLGGNVALV